MTATESQAAPDLALDSPAFGPQPPDRADLYAAQDAPLRVDLSDAEYDRLLAERIQTEIAYKATCDRESARELEAGATDPEAEAEWEAEWADNWDSADSHAYMDRVEACLEPEAEP